jgi:hypothetical protein
LTIIVPPKEFFIVSYAVYPVVAENGCADPLKKRTVRPKSAFVGTLLKIPGKGNGWLNLFSIGNLFYWKINYTFATLVE